MTAALLPLAAALATQIAPNEQPTPSPTPPVVPVITDVTPPVVVLPTPMPTATPVPQAKEEAIVPTPAPTRATRTLEPAAAPLSAPAREQPAAPPVPALNSVGAGQPEPPSDHGILWLAVAAVVTALGAGAFWYRRRLPTLPSITPPETPAAEPPTPVAAPLTVTFRATRAGVNLLSVLVEGEVEIAATDRAVDIAVHATLTSAHRGHEDALAALFVGPVQGSPIAADFALDPHQRRSVTVRLAQPLQAMTPIDAAGRQLIAPVVAISVGWTDRDGRRRRLSQAFVVGIERVDSAKLAPFWLDQPRTTTQVAARPHLQPIEA